MSAKSNSSNNSGIGTNNLSTPNSSSSGKKRPMNDILSTPVMTPSRGILMQSDNESSVNTFSSYPGTAASTPTACHDSDIRNSASISSASGAAAANPGSTDFANKFRRLRACARCHRLKMRCVFEDPAFESCTRCFKAGIQCSMTEDPTISTAKSRPRKKAKLKGAGPLAILQSSMSEAAKLFNTIQKQASENKSKESININSNNNNNQLITKVDYQNLDENLTGQTLGQLQLQLSELQRLLSHVINMNFNKTSTTPDSEGANNVASSINSMKDGPVKPIPNLPWIPFELNIIKELIKLKILTEDDVMKRYDFFVNNLISVWPCVSIPRDYTYEWLVDNEPLVLLGFITVTCLNEPDLHDTLLYYLEGNLAQKVSLTGDITATLVQIYLVLSLWCSPPRKWGSYKHQMSLMTALNLTLCLDLGNEMYTKSQNVLRDNSEERKILRAYMGVYCCCGSLGLSLPRFKVVSFTSNHERMCQLLLLGDSNRFDKFICYYARLIAIGEEILQFLCPNNFVTHSTNQLSSEAGIDPISTDYGWNSSNLPHQTLRAMMISYEKKMQKLAAESQLFQDDSKQKSLLSIIYYQLLMTMYDYVVCRVLLKKDMLTDIYLQTLNRLIKASEKVIDSFVALCHQTPVFPTFFYYRPMHALVALIRARLLVKSQALDLEINVEGEYERVSSALNLISEKSKVAKKMKMILTRIAKWMKVSDKFNKDGATNSMVDLLHELGKEKAVENIRISIKKKEGDNGNLNSDSRIQFNKFINYNMETLGKKSGLPQQQQNQQHQQHQRKINSSPSSWTPTPQTNTQSSIQGKAENFMPSPIGFTNSEFAESPAPELLRKQQLQQQAQQLPPDYNPSTVQSDDSVPALDDAKVPRTRLQSRSSIGGFGAPTPTFSISNPSSTGNTGSRSASVEEQQQHFLNDLFSQIDSDVMNLQVNGDFYDLMGSGDRTPSGSTSQQGGQQNFNFLGEEGYGFW